MNKFRLRKAIARGVGLARDFVPPSVQDRMPVGMRKLAERLLNSGKSGVQQLEDRLWGGFSQSALVDLKALAEDGTATAGSRFEALRVLAAWSVAQKEFEAALALVERAAEIAPDRAKAKRLAMLQAQLFGQLGQAQKIRNLLGAQSKFGAFDSTHELLLANSWNPACVASPEDGSIDRALGHINAIYRQFGVCDIRLIDADGPLSMDNIEGVGCAAASEPERTIGIIVPAYNAADIIETALRGIAQQSWTAFKVLVVDDCSTDDTCAVVEAFCAGDERFSLYRKTENSGTYASRNLALDILDTPYVTVHDADDWSHPQKLERQMAALAASGDDYNYTMLVRATPDLMFMSEAKPTRRLLVPNHWAGLFKTDVVRKAGGWDHARISADTELFWRLEALKGNRKETTRHRRVMVECPLAIGRVLPSSLTQMGPTHTLTMYHGVRREYREAAAFWHHNEMNAGNLNRPFFVAPSLMRPGVANEPTHDLFVIADFIEDGFAARSALDKAVCAARHGKSAAILPYRAYDRDVTMPLPDEIRRMASQYGLRIVAPGEKVKTRLALVAEAQLLQHRLDRFPEVEAGRTIVVADRLPGQAQNGLDPEAIMANGRAMLGGDVRWAGTSSLGERHMEKDARFDAPFDAVVWPLVEGALSTPEGQVHGNGAVLRVGVLDEGETLRRVTSVAAMLRDVKIHHLADSADRGQDVRGARSTLIDLFAEIDFFIYFPQSEFSEPFGYPVAMAMAHGVPVITALELEANFGSAVLYGEPDTAWEMARKLRDDHALRQGMADAGRQAAASIFGPKVFVAQLDDYIKRSQAPV